MGLLDVQVVQQADDVFDHLGAVFFDFVRLAALAVSPIVQSNHVIVLAEVGEHSRHDPVHHGVGREPVNQNDGFAFTFRDVVNLDAVGEELPLLRRGNGDGCRKQQNHKPEQRSLSHELRSE